MTRLRGIIMRGVNAAILQGKRVITARVQKLASKPERIIKFTAASQMMRELLSAGYKIERGAANVSSQLSGNVMKIRRGAPLSEFWHESGHALDMHGTADGLKRATAYANAQAAQKATGAAPDLAYRQQTRDLERRANRTAQQAMTDRGATPQYIEKYRSEVAPHLNDYRKANPVAGSPLPKIEPTGNPGSPQPSVSQPSAPSEPRPIKRNFGGALAVGGIAAAGLGIASAGRKPKDDYEGFKLSSPSPLIQLGAGWKIEKAARKLAEYLLKNQKTLGLSAIEFGRGYRPGRTAKKPIQFAAFDMYRTWMEPIDKSSPGRKNRRALQDAAGRKIDLPAAKPPRVSTGGIKRTVSQDRLDELAKRQSERFGMGVRTDPQLGYAPSTEEELARQRKAMQGPELYRAENKVKEPVKHTRNKPAPVDAWKHRDPKAWLAANKAQGRHADMPDPSRMTDMQKNLMRKEAQAFRDTEAKTLKSLRGRIQEMRKALSPGFKPLENFAPHEGSNRIVGGMNPEKWEPKGALKIGPGLSTPENVHAVIGHVDEKAGSQISAVKSKLARVVGTLKNRVAATTGIPEGPARHSQVKGYLEGMIPSEGPTAMDLTKPIDPTRTERIQKAMGWKKPSHVEKVRSAIARLEHQANSSEHLSQVRQGIMKNMVAAPKISALPEGYVPGAALKKLGRIAGGTALVGAGIYGVRKYLNRKKEEPKQLKMSVRGRVIQFVVPRKVKQARRAIVAAFDPARKWKATATADRVMSESEKRGGTAQRFFPDLYKNLPPRTYKIHGKPVDAQRMAREQSRIGHEEKLIDQLVRQGRVSRIEKGITPERAREWGDIHASGKKTAVGKLDYDILKNEGPADAPSRVSAHFAKASDAARAGVADEKRMPLALIKPVPSPLADRIAATERRAIEAEGLAGKLKESVESSKKAAAESASRHSEEMKRQIFRGDRNLLIGAGVTGAAGLGGGYLIGRRKKEIQFGVISNFWGRESSAAERKARALIEPLQKRLARGERDLSNYKPLAGKKNLFSDAYYTAGDDKRFRGEMEEGIGFLKDDIKTYGEQAAKHAADARRRKIIDASVIAGGAGIAGLSGYLARRKKKKEVQFSEKKRQLSPWQQTGISAAASGAVLGALPAFQHGSTFRGVAKSIGVGAGLGALIGGGGTYIGTKILGNPRKDDPVGITKRAAVGGTIAGLGIGTAGALALRRGHFPNAMKDWRPVTFIRRAGAPAAIATGAGTGALIAGSHAADEGQQVDTMRSLKKSIRMSSRIKPIQLDSIQAPLTGKLASDRYRKRIQDEDLDRRDANLLRTAGAGALLGTSLAPFGKIRGKHAAAIGAGLGAASVLGVRQITKGGRDIYGERTREAKQAEGLPWKAAIAGAGILGGKRIYDKVKWIGKRPVALARNGRLIEFRDWTDKWTGENVNYTARHEDVTRWGGRGSRLIRDIGRKARGEEHKDSRGRVQTPEWQKPWAKKAMIIGGVGLVLGSGVLGRRKLKSLASAHAAIPLASRPVERFAHNVMEGNVTHSVKSRIGAFVPGPVKRGYEKVKGFFGNVGRDISHKAGSKLDKISDAVERESNIVTTAKGKIHNARKVNEAVASQEAAAKEAKDIAARAEEKIRIMRTPEEQAAEELKNTIHGKPRLFSSKAREIRFQNWDIQDRSRHTAIVRTGDYNKDRKQREHTRMSKSTGYLLRDLGIAVGTGAGLWIGHKRGFSKAASTIPRPPASGVAQAVEQVPQIWIPETVRRIQAHSLSPLIHLNSKLDSLLT